MSRGSPLHVVRPARERPYRKRAKSAGVPVGRQRYRRILNAGEVEGDLTGLPWPVRLAQAARELEQERDRRLWLFWTRWLPVAVFLAIALVSIYSLVRGVQ